MYGDGRIFGGATFLTTGFVVGLNRTGKSCRLRWVNYLHPGLKRGKMTPLEEKLVLELHSQWGNRWSRIARNLPGRTDNEIKNYWRTHTRKKAQEKKRAMSSSSSSSSVTSSSAAKNPPADSPPISRVEEVRFHDTGGKKGEKLEENDKGYYSMDQIWKDIDLFDDDTIKPVFDGYMEEVASPTWDCYSDSLWRMDEIEESKMVLPINDDFLSFYEHGKGILTG